MSKIIISEYIERDKLKMIDKFKILILIYYWCKKILTINQSHIFIYKIFK